jgi:Tfp pilus assembly protein PilZ
VEQRRSRRHIVQVRLLYFSKGQPRAVDAECTNVSAHGLFVKTRRRGAETGTPVSIILKVETDGSEDELMLEGIVRWQGAVRNLTDRSEGAGMGVEFTSMEPSVRKKLDAYIALLEAEESR